MARQGQMVKRCKNRGGDCPCRDGQCQAIREINRELGTLTSKIRQLEQAKLRLESPMANLRDGFTFREGLDPVMVFDGTAASFGYEDPDGEWIESDEWPFDRQWIWFDDCERNGIRVE